VLSSEFIRRSRETLAVTELLTAGGVGEVGPQRRDVKVGRVVASLEISKFKNCAGADLGG